MCDWKTYVRDRLSLPGTAEPLENEIIEEVACQLEDCYLEAIARGVPEGEAKAGAEASFRSSPCSTGTRSATSAARSRTRSSRRWSS